MTVLKKLRDAGEALIARAPVRWMALLLVSAAVVATAANSYREIDKELTAVALLRRETVAKITAVTIAEKFGRVVDVAISLSTRVHFRDLVARGKWNEAINIMRDVPRDLPHIERLFLADTEGTLKADVPALPQVRDVNFAHREWYQGVSRNWQPYVSPVYTRAAPPQIKVFAVAAPIRNAGGAVTGILVLQLRVENLLEWINAIDTGRRGFIYLVDSKGQVAFHSRHPDRPGIADLSKTAVVEKLLRGEHGVETGHDPVENEEAIVAYAPVPGYGWGVVSQQPLYSSLAYTTKQAQLRRLMTGYAFILALCLLAIVLTSRIAGERRRAEDDRRMKAELELRVTERTRQLDAANQELEAFSYSVSHDLRAPLRSIDGFSQALIEDCAGRLTDECRGHLERIRSATQRMGTLIDDLLMLSRVTRAEMRRELMDLTQTVRSVIAGLEIVEPGRKVECRVQEHMALDGDPRLMRIVLENLLGNAWKFTQRADPARIEVGSAMDAAGTPVYFVRDNGVGFDMNYADKLFGAFQRLHAASDFPGTGIGLATVQRIIHRHGGRVWAEGETGKGASFYFTLGPTPRPAPQEHAA
ncbi:MAG: cache domain-containing protein [Pseudomonadota bacterium]